MATAEFNPEKLSAIWGESGVEFLPITSKDQINLKIFNLGLRSAHPDLLSDLSKITKRKLQVSGAKWKKSYIFFQPGPLTWRFDSTYSGYNYKNILLSSENFIDMNFINSVQEKLDFYSRKYFWQETNSADAIYFLFIKINLFNFDKFWYDKYIKKDLLDNNIEIWSQQQGGGLNYNSINVKLRQEEFRKKINLTQESIFWDNMSDIYNNNFKPESLKSYKYFIETVMSQSESTTLILIPQNPVITQYTTDIGKSRLLNIQKELCNIKKISCINLTEIPVNQSDFFDFIHYSEVGWTKIKAAIF